MVVISHSESDEYDLSVIMCAHNEQSHVRDQLDALAAQVWSGRWELIVVDNNSTDATPDIVREYASKHPQIRLISATERAGQSYAMNTGSQVARARKLAFCDADDIVAPGWVAAIARGLEAAEVVTGPHELDLLNPRWLADSRGRSAEEAVGSFFGIFPTIRGANWGIRRDTWERFGGIDERFSAGQDADLSLRYWLGGVDIKGIPDAVVHYRYRRSTAALWSQGFAYGAFRPRLVKRLVSEGRPRPSRFAGWKSWGQLVLRVPTLVTRQGRAVWVWIAANRIGQLVGSIRERTLLL